MSTLREAAQQALEALESCSGVPHWPALQPTITALRAALEQAEPTDLCWAEAPKRTQWGAGMMEGLVALGKDHTLRLYAEREALPLVVPALRAALAQEEQEPVAWMMVNREHATLARSLHWRPQTDWHITWEAIPLFTHPPRREWRSLTEEEIDAVMPYCHNKFELHEYMEVARAIEQALRSKNNG